MADAASGRLNSWKDIARHLHRDVRTVRRWEHERGMPVHRVPGGGSASVFALVDEIDKWLAGSTGPHGRWVSDRRPGQRHRRWLIAAAVAAAGVFVVIFGLLLFRARLPTPRPIQRLASKGNSIRAIDEAGQTRWEYPLPAPSDLPDSAESTFVGAPDRGGGQLLIAAVESAQPQQGVEASLYSFDTDGRVRWRLAPHDRLRFASGEYGPSWSCQNSVLVPIVIDGQRRFVWLLHHLTWWPSRMMVLDANGATHGEFVNSGWLAGVKQSPDGRFLLVSGVSNSAEAPIVAVLDARRPSGTSPEQSDSPYACLNCPSGAPARYLVFPRSTLARFSGFRVLAPTVGAVDNGFEVRVPEGAGEPIPETIYEFSPDFRLLRASRSDGYRNAVKRLESAAAGSTAGDGIAPREEQDALGVRVWHAAAGWTIERPAYPAATADRH